MQTAMESRPESLAASPKQYFLDMFIAEHGTTMKVLRAFPPTQSEFRPHPNSQSARELAFTFTMEQKLISLALRDQLKLGGGRPQMPESFTDIVDQFDRDFHELVRLIGETPDAQFSTTIQFPRGPGKMGDWPKLEFCWFMLHDQIHHRGQMSVYLRLVGAKVPAIYGPSRDEPFF